MTAKKKRSASVRDEVEFITRTHAQPGTVDLHRERSSETLVRKLEDVKRDWKVMSAQILELVSTTESTTTQKGFTLSEVSVSLGFNAKGKLAFIAEAGVEGSVTVVLKRA